MSAPKVGRTPPTPRSTKLEVGMVYKDGPDLCLALPGGRLFTVRPGAFVKTYLPTRPVLARRQAKFEDLLRAWKVAEGTADALLGEFFKPRFINSRPPREGPPRKIDVGMRIHHRIPGAHHLTRSANRLAS